MDYLEQLEQLRQPTSVSDFARLSRRLRTHVIALEEQTFEYETLDLPLAKEIAARLTALIDEIDGLTPEQRTWVRGAIDYFLITTDADDDVTSPTGLVDDALVLNHTLEQIGRPERKIDLDNR